MAERSRGLLPSKIIIIVLSVFLLILPTSSEKNKEHEIKTLCENTFLRQLYRKIDGAVLRSQNERSLDCIVTFQTHSVLQRFMLRFDHLKLDCNDHLLIFDGAHATENAKADLTCWNTTESIGAIFTTTNFVTLKYITDKWGMDFYGFKLVITAVKDPKHACKDFRCNLQEFCIASDLVCDKINHCGDGSDEFASAMCSPDELGTVLGMSITLLVVIFFTVLLLLCVCVVSLSLCICRRSPTPASPHQTNYSPNYPMETVETVEMVQHGRNGIGGGGTTVIPMSGNWRHPAG